MVRYLALNRKDDIFSRALFREMQHGYQKIIIVLEKIQTKPHTLLILNTCYKVIQ